MLFLHGPIIMWKNYKVNNIQKKQLNFKQFRKKEIQIQIAQYLNTHIFMILDSFQKLQTFLPNADNIVIKSLIYIFIAQTRTLIVQSPMSMSQNAKRSITYQFELTSSKILAPVVRYKGHSRLYQLNVSKMLLKCPDQLFLNKESQLENPQQLMIVSTQKYHSSQRHKQIINREVINCCRTDLNKTKIETFKKSIRQTLINQEKNQNNYQLALIEESEFIEKQQPTEKIQEDSRTAESPTLHSPQNTNKYSKSSTNSSKFINKNILTIKCKKMYDSALSPSSRRQSFLNKPKFQLEDQSNNQTPQTGTENSQNKQIHKKFSYNQQHIIKHSKISKKLLLPQIKSPTIDKNSNPHTYNMSAKSNIPLLFRDPQQLKHIKAQAYSIIQYPTGNLILSNKGLNQYEIASLTKIMTFYTVVKIANKYSLNLSAEKVKITQIAMDMSGTSAQILADEVYTVQQLLYGLMLPSGNDAATALAEWGSKHILRNTHPHSQHNAHSPIHHSLQHNNTPQNVTSIANTQQIHPGSPTKLKTFIAEMNANAKQLGLNMTRFANPHGLPNSQARSTAIDVARLCFQCLNDELFRKIVSTTNYKCTTHQYSHPDIKRSVEWINTNKLLRRDGFIGIKTGITVTAGPCLASAYQFRDKVYICVVLRATKVSRRFKDTRKLLAWSLDKLYKDSLTAEEKKMINSLKKNKPDLDSDYSEDQQQFNYQHMSVAQLKKRNNIINYEM